MQEANTIKEVVSPEVVIETTTPQVSTPTISSQESTGASAQTLESESIVSTGAQSGSAKEEANVHPNLLKMAGAYQLIINNPEFYKSDSRVNKFIEACKLPDPALKLWKASLTNARKELNDKAMEWARTSSVPVVMPTEEEITNLACDKFRESWRKVGKGKPMPALPLSV